MKYSVLSVILLLVISHLLEAQTKAELEAQRKKTLEEISYVDNLIKTTAKERSESMAAVTMIGKKLTLRESVLAGMKDEISLLSERISLNALAIKMMEDDLVELRRDYANAVVNSYKQKKGYPDIVYILSARDFNQGYKRIKYLQQVTKYRRKESEVILELKDQVETSKEKLQADLDRVSELKENEEQQRSLLQAEQDRRQRMVRSLANKEKQLQKELDEKKRIAKRIETEIAKIIEEEKKRALASDITPEERLIGESFAENKGRLPWPVDKGVITSHFGMQKHPVLKYVTENNFGIEITSSGKTVARSVFQGEIVQVFAIQGANMTVIIRHGKYLSVYANILNVKVKKGDMVATKQEIGDVYSDASNGNSSVLKFMITLESNYQDPELWISKK